MKPKVVILAGGAGTRFAPFATNKTMWSLMGRPLIGHLIDRVIAAGYLDIIIVSNSYNHEYISTSYTGKCNLTVRSQSESLGMSDALLTVRDVIGTHPIILLNGVDLIDMTLLSHLHRDPSSPSLGGMHMPGHHPLGYLRVEGDRVTQIVEKPSPDTMPSEIIKLTSDYLPHPEILLDSIAALAHTHADDLYEQALNTLIAQTPVTHTPYSGRWSKLKYPHSVLDVSSHLLSTIESTTIHETAYVSPHAHIEGHVIVDAGARIETGAIIKGPSYIGARTIIGAGALVRDSMIESDVVIGYGSEIGRSYVGPGCRTHHAFVGDSVLEGDINMSWGTVTANFRLDGKPVKITLPDGSRYDTGRQKLGALIARGAFLGVDTSTMPGTVIAPGTKTHPKSIVK